MHLVPWFQLSIKELLRVLVITGSRFRVDSRTENPERAPIEIWKVLKELERKKITKAAFCKALGITEHQLSGCGKFPAEKVDECLRLLENWPDKK